MAESGVTFTVDNVQERGPERMIQLSGKATRLTPDIVLENRARMKAIRVMGLESFGREAAEMIMSGDLSRVTEIEELEKHDVDGIGVEILATVVVRDFD